MSDRATATAQLATVRETEVKLSVPAEADLADLLGAVTGDLVATVGPPSTATLRTSYFDTGDLRLAREGLTLRQRRGDDEGWHLKLPAAGGRDEIRAPLRGTDPPSALRSLVHVYTRSERLHRVATLETTRTTRHLLGANGDLLGVVVDDAVRVLTESGESGAFREIEVEAAPAVTDPAPLLRQVTKALTAAGATVGDQTPKAVRALGAAAQEPPSPPPPGRVRRKAPAGAVITARLRQQVRALMGFDVAIRRELPDAVPQMWDAVHGLRSTLLSVGPLVDDGWAGDLAAELAWVATVLAEVRDLDVLQAGLVRRTAGLPLDAADTAALTTHIEQQLSAARATARSGVLGMLDGDRYQRLVDRLVEAATEPRLTPVAGDQAATVLPPLVAAAASVLRKRTGRLEAEPADAQPADGQRADGEPSITEAAKDPYARARDAADRARSVAELSALALGRRATDIAAHAEELQEVLREHADAAAGASAVRRLVTGVGSPEVAFGLGLLAAAQGAAIEESRAAVAPARRGFQRAATRKWLR